MVSARGLDLVDFPLDHLNPASAEFVAAGDVDQVRAFLRASERYKKSGPELLAHVIALKATQRVVEIDLVGQGPDGCFVRYLVGVFAFEEPAETEGIEGAGSFPWPKLP